MRRNSYLQRSNMQSEFVTIKNDTLNNSFFLDEGEEKENMTFSDFIKSIGLRQITTNINIDGVRDRVYQIIDHNKWFLAKIKYGI